MEHEENIANPHRDITVLLELELILLLQSGILFDDQIAQTMWFIPCGGGYR